MPNKEIICVANDAQLEFLSLKKRYSLYVGGFGAGKTHALAMGLCATAWKTPRVLTSYYAPTLKMVRDIFYPKIEAVADSLSLKAKIKVGNYEVQLYRERELRSVCLCRSMENPQNIIGVEAGRIAIDELDTLPTNKAELAWNKIIGRARAKGIENRVDVGTTPEGHKFVYQKFIKEVRDNPALEEYYGVVRASTYDNKRNLPDGYIDSLLSNYPKQLIDAYLNGEFVNLTSGTVYNAYDAKAHDSNETINAAEPLFIGQDFNVGKMCSAIFVKRPNGFHAVEQLKDIYDTPALIRTLQDRYRANTINVYPDASGGNRHTNASDTDIALLKQAGYNVRCNNSNPAVRDRVLAVNVSFEKGRLFVNSRKCPRISECLERQFYDANGEPDKTAGYDHMNDAVGYMVAYENPVNKPVFATNIRAWG